MDGTGNTRMDNIQMKNFGADEEEYDPEKEYEATLISLMGPLNVPMFTDDDLTAENVAACKEAFAMFDTNADGAISVKELTPVMRSLGLNPTENDILEVMNNLDIDGDGVISLDEFVHITLGRMRLMDTEDEIRKVFRVFDKDGNGYLSAVELKYMLTNIGQRLGEEEVEELLAEADIDGDGRLNYEEFVQMLVSQ